MKYPETARRLSEALNDKKMKAAELAAKTGITKGAISQYINGLTKIGDKNAEKAAKILGVSSMWLMGYNVDKYFDMHKFDVIIEPHYSEIGDYPERMQAIISYMRQLSPEGLEKLQERAEELTELPKYKKE